MIEVLEDKYYMKKALEEAEKAFKKGEIPVGAVIVANQQIIAKGHNLTQQLNDVTAHAEMQCITAAADFLGGKYLKKCTLYVTLEPCVMCAGALNWSQITKIVYGASDLKKGAGRYDNLFHPQSIIKGGELAEECAHLLNEFFKEKR